jgi:phosphatidylserine decarboxylase
MPLRLHERLALATLARLPLNAISRVAGRLARVRLPGPIQRAAIRLFGAALGVDFAEVRDPLDRFESLQAFFTRALADGARPVDPAPDAFVAPCDGAWGQCGRVEAGTLLQVKGRGYALAELLGSPTDAASFEGGRYATFYLAPRDYHRFHTPCAVRVERARYLPGALLPVNRLGVEGVDALFARNERICAFMATRDEGPVDLCLVAVGATLVGSVRVTFDDLATNTPGSGIVDRLYAAGAHPFAKGQEWGRFEFGSTLVVVAAPGVVELDVAGAGTALRLGSRIGTLARPD